MSWPASSDRSADGSSHLTAGSRASGLGFGPFVPSLGDLVDESDATDVRATPSIFAYELASPSRPPILGWLGAVAIADDASILPHERTYDEVVSSRLDLIMATGADLDPLYLLTVPRAGSLGATEGTSGVLTHVVGDRPPTLTWEAPDGVMHRLWQVTEPREIEAVRAAVSGESAVIADGHHRFTAYVRRHTALADEHGPGPWDAALALLVDADRYVPAVAPVHRVVPGQKLADALERLRPLCAVTMLDGSVLSAGADLDDAARAALRTGRKDGVDGSVMLVTDGERIARIVDDRGVLAAHACQISFGGALTSPTDVPDASVAVDAVVGWAWGHAPSVAVPSLSAENAVAMARQSDGTALLLAATPTATVIDMARSGLTLPQKSTMFVPKPVAGLVERALADQHTGPHGMPTGNSQVHPPLGCDLDAVSTP